MGTLPHVDDANLEDLARELGEKRDMLLVHALVHYIHAGHPYVLAMRSANAIPWLEHGQYLLAVRLDDSNDAAIRTRIPAYGRSGREE